MHYHNCVWIEVWREETRGDDGVSHRVDFVISWYGLVINLTGLFMNPKALVISCNGLVIILNVFYKSGGFRYKL